MDEIPQGSGCCGDVLVNVAMQYYVDTSEIRRILLCSKYLDFIFESTAWLCCKDWSTSFVHKELTSQY